MLFVLLLEYKALLTHLAKVLALPRFKELMCLVRAFRLLLLSHELIFVHRRNLAESKRTYEIMLFLQTYTLFELLFSLLLFSLPDPLFLRIVLRVYNFKGDFFTLFYVFSRTINLVAFAAEKSAGCYSSLANGLHLWLFFDFNFLIIKILSPG